MIAYSDRDIEESSYQNRFFRHFQCIRIFFRMRLLYIFFLSIPLFTSASEPEQSLDQDILPEIAFGQQPSILTESSYSSLQVLENSYKHPSVAVLLSALFPGLGHVYMQDMKTAASLIGSSGVSLGAVCYSSDSFDYGIEAISTIWMYGLYATYRDVNLYNGISHRRYKMPTDDFADVALAPLKWSIIKKPEVWGGVLGSFLVAVSLVSLKDRYQSLADHGQSMGGAFYPFVAFPTAISEEALFRGFLQSQLSEWLTPVGGIFTSSLLFGAAHILNGLSMNGGRQKAYFRVSIPFITCMGAYQGWLTYKNSSLQESVALHTWYDFILMGIGSWTPEAASLGYDRFSISFSF